MKKVESCRFRSNGGIGLAKNIFTVRFKTVHSPERSVVLPGHFYEFVNCSQLVLTYGLKKMSVSITPSFEEQDVEEAVLFI